MCSRESLSRRCVLVKKVPEEFIYQCIYNIRGVEKCQRHNELSIGNGEETLIVLFRSEEDAENLLKKGYVTLDSSGKMFDLPVVGCSEFFIPNDWIYPFHKLDLSFINTMEDSIRMKSVGLMEEGKKIDCDNTNVKVGKEKEDKLEDIESQDIYIPKFTIPSITSPYNSTVAQVAVLSAENFQREEIKDLEKQQRRESYVKKEKLCTESPRPSVGRSEERTHGHEEEETDEETSFDTVRVRLRKPLSQGAIENYFENRRKSGGGDIESFEVIKEEDEQILEALITFRQSSDAKSCLQRRHKIGGHNLTVEKYDLNDPEMWEMNKVLVKNLFPGTTDDTLMNYLEPAAGVDPIEVVRGSKPDTVIVVFEEKPDFSKMSKRCNSRKLNGKSLFIQMVEKCRSVYAQDIDESFTYDTVENFFCNKKRSGGGEVEELDYHPEDGYCVVLFENPEDAENVASREKFTMNGKEIKVQMLYSQLGLPEQPINWADLPSIIFPCEKHFIKFVKNCEVVAKEIDNTMQQKFVKVEWPKSKSDFNVKLLCSVTKEVENARGNLKKWKEEAEKSMKSLVGKYSVQKHSISPESWGNFLDKLNMLNIDHPEKVAVSLEAKQHVVVVVGLEENTEALTRKILDIVKAEELKIKTQKEKIEKNVPLDFHKCQQLLNTDYQRMINDFPDVEIKIGKKGVNFTGKPNDVNEAIIKMHEYLINTKSKSIFQGINEGFKTKEVRKFLAKNQKERIAMQEPELPPSSTEREKQPPERRCKVNVESTEIPSQGRSEERTPGLPEEEEETDEGTSFDTVRVRLSKPMSQDAIENYFENTRKSGGGDIQFIKIMMEEDEQIVEALITFRQSSDAKSCLERRHTIIGQTLTVEKYDENDPEMWEMNKVLVTNLHPETTDDTLMNFLEPAAGVDPIEVVRGSKSETVIVLFDEKPDFSKMSKRCNSRKLHGKSLFIRMVEKCRSVYAQDIDECITYNAVENFFCNKRRSGGGEVEEMDYHPEDGYCVVLFKNPTAVWQAKKLSESDPSDIQEIQKMSEIEINLSELKF